MATQQKKNKGAPRRKNRDMNSRPSRTRYWGEGRLEKRKVANLMKNPRYKACPTCRGVKLADDHRCPECNGEGRVANPMTKAEAGVSWSRSRKGRGKYLALMGGN